MGWLLKAVTGNPMILIWIALGAFAAGVVSGGGAAWTVQGWRLAAEKADFAKFRAETKALGDVAAAKAKAQEDADKKRKEKADADYKKLTADNAVLVKRLRNARPSSSFVPAAPAGSSRPDLICFDRAEYQRADGIFTAGARGLADEGTANTIIADTAKQWAQGK